MYLFKRVKTFMYEILYIVYTLVETTNGNRLADTIPFSHLKSKKKSKTRLKPNCNFGRYLQVIVCFYNKHPFYNDP